MSEFDNPTLRRSHFLRMVTDITATYASNNTFPASQIPNVIKSVYNSLSALTREGSGGHDEMLKPAVPIRRSITPDYIICLEDGKKLKMLKRHLRVSYGLTPDEYRTKWGLPLNYPIVAPNYAAKRSVLAKKIGLGRKPERKRKAKLAIS